MKRFEDVKCLLITLSHYISLIYLAINCTYGNWTYVFINIAMFITLLFL